MYNKREFKRSKSFLFSRFPIMLFDGFVSFKVLNLFNTIANTIQMKSRLIRSAGHVPRIGEIKRIGLKILIGKLYNKESLGVDEETNITIYLKKIEGSSRNLIYSLRIGIIGMNL